MSKSYVLGAKMVRIEFFPETSNIIIKPQKYFNNHTEDPLLVTKLFSFLFKFNVLLYRLYC